MENVEQYYYNAYKVIEKLQEIYKDGYDKDTIKKHWLDYKIENLRNLERFQQEQDSLKLTIMIALIGLNKEQIEKTEKHSDYENNIIEEDLRDAFIEPYKTALKDKLEEEKQISTVFDNWFSITKKNDKEYSNLEYIKMIRNALLHSEFTVNYDGSLYLGLINIKNYEHFHARIYLYNFIQFVFAYYGNLPGMGISTQNLFYDFPDRIKITSSRKLEKYIKHTRITEIIYELKSSYDGNNTLEKQLYDNSKNLKITPEDLSNILKNNQNNLNITNIGNITLGKEYIKFLKERIEYYYGKEFYKFSKENQKKIIIALLETELDNKRILSNWLCHFYHFSNSLFKNELDTNYFQDDELYNNNCNNSLLILKAYLVLYRLQNKEFEEIDYNKIDFDFTKDDYLLESSDINPEKDIEDNFEKGLNRLKVRYPEENEDVLRIMQICNVIRDSLAHGNVRLFQNKEQEHIIEFTNINPKDGSIRIIKMTISKLEQFLSSKIFLPKDYIQKEPDEKVKVINI